MRKRSEAERAARKAELNEERYAEAEEIVAAMREAGVTIGYIGNVYSSGPPEKRDDRSWRIFLPAGNYFDGKSSLGGYPTEERGKLLRHARLLLIGYRLGVSFEHKRRLHAEAEEIPG